MMINESWLALAIGNSRLHWAWFGGKTLCRAWDAEHLDRPWGGGELSRELEAVKERVGGPPPLYIASVVPQQTALWQTYPNVRIITLNQLPLRGVYPTLGIDRALAVLGAGEVWGFPTLAIDAGTALTFTGADVNRRLVGGAILPGLGLQLKSLTQKTAALPAIDLPKQLPRRFALSTQEAIQSGVIYTLLAGMQDFIEDWWRQFPASRIVLTGGDRAVLLTYLQTEYPEIAAGIIAEPHLIFWGMRSIVHC